VSSIGLAAIFYVAVLQQATSDTSDLKVYMATSTSLDQKLNKLRELATQAASPLGLEVLSVKIGQQGKYRTFEVCIFDRAEPIGLTQCEKVNRALDSLLEPEDLVSGPYLIEVVSPGTDRELKNSQDFEVFAGKSVRVKTREKVGVSGNDFIATLVGGTDQEVRLTDLHAFDIATKKNARKVSKAQEEGNLAVAVQSSSEVVLDLSNVFKINLYSDDLKRN
jgi:ribosome maturation factor RimP